MARPRRPRGGEPPLDPAAAYERLAAAYPPCAHNPLMRMEQQAMLELLGEVRGKRCLDLGCGSGRYLRLLREAGAARVLGADLSAAMLERARGDGFAVVRCAAAALPCANERFDLVACGLLVGHLPALGPVLAEAARVLAPGGALVYSDLHPAGTLAGWERALPDAAGRVLRVRQHLHLYADHVAACREAGLEIEGVREPRLGPGSPWPGWPAVLVVRAVRGAPRGRA